MINYVNLVGEIYNVNKLDDFTSVSHLDSVLKVTTPIMPPPTPPITPIKTGCQSPSWSPIPDTSRTMPSTPNNNLLSSILLETGIYSPRGCASIPKINGTWERSTASNDSGFALPSVSNPAENNTSRSYAAEL